MQIVTTYDQIIERDIVKGICLKCGKTRTRTLVESMTENPFNKNPDGSVRSRSEIIQAVRDNLYKSTEKLKNKFICATCFKNLPYGEKW